MLEFPIGRKFVVTICSSKLRIRRKAHLLLGATASDLGFPSPESLGQEPGLRTRAPREIWMVGSQLSQLSMGDAEVGVLSSARATRRETLPRLGKQPTKTLLLAAPAFLYQDGAADSGLGQI